MDDFDQANVNNQGQFEKVERKISLISDDFKTKVLKFAVYK